MVPQWFSFSAARDPAYAAALALVIIQVGIGIIYKSAQSGGSYSFSTSGSIAISEFLKFVLSTALFYRECRRRWVTSPAEYQLPLFQSSRSSFEEHDLAAANDGHSSSDTSNLDETTVVDEKDGMNSHDGPLGIFKFFTTFKREVPQENLYGFAQLALLYSLINNSIFVSYQLADPGTIQLLKSGITLITAIVLFYTQGTKIVKVQWIAIIIQICGLVVTQYHPESGASYPFTTYLLLILQTTISASAGVYNQQLLKSHEVSLHANNMVLYCAGASLNFVIHILVSIVKLDEPGFFVGYGNAGAIMVVLSNVFIGLAITAVYKYADAVIKCFATAVSTGVLLYLSPILFGSEMSFLVLPGTLVVFIATWLYMEAAPPKQSPNLPDTEPSGTPKSLPRSLLGGGSTNVSYQINIHVHIRKALIAFEQGWKRISTLVTTTILTTIIIVALALAKTQMPDQATEPKIDLHDEMNTKTADTSSPKFLESPFQNTMAFTRFNFHIPERLPTVRHYERFFHTLHISMPEPEVEDVQDYPRNATYDSYPNLGWGHDTFYTAVADAMRDVLHTPSSKSITGLLLFHFDVWIDPIAFSTESLDNMWILASERSSPRFRCGRDKKEMDENWEWFRDGGDRTVAHAVQEVVGSGYGLHPDDAEFCQGWSDFLYVPRRFFEEFIFLAGKMKEFQVYHEMAFPTILHIIDQTRRAHPSLPVLNRIGDCWGDCCNMEPPTTRDILSMRCGHKLDYRNEDVWKPHFERLAQEASQLGSTIKPPAKMFNTTKVSNTSNVTTLLEAPTED